MIVMHPDAARFPRPVHVNVKKMKQTSALTDEQTFGPLRPEAENAIDDTIAGQMDSKREGTLMPGYLLEHGQMPGSVDKGGKPSGGIRTLFPEIYHQEQFSHNQDSPGSPGNPPITPPPINP